MNNIRNKILQRRRLAKVCSLMKREMYKQEEKAKEINESKDRGKKMWECIEKLRGENVKEKNALGIFVKMG